MRALVTFLALAGSAGLWGWALMGEPPAPPLPGELVGTFRLFDYRGTGEEPTNPLGQGRDMVYEFRDDGTYVLRILVDKTVELARVGGTIRPAEKDEVVLTGVAENARAIDGQEERFRVIWAYDEEGEYLNLTQVTEQGPGRQLLLRRE